MKQSECEHLIPSKSVELKIEDFKKPDIGENTDIAVISTNTEN